MLGWRKGESVYCWWELNWSSYMEISMEVPQKTKRIIVWPSCPMPG